MEQKFKVGDRVRHETLGNGTITLSGVDPYCHDHRVDFGIHGDVWMHERVLTLIDPANTSQPITQPTDPSRAMIAAMCLQGMLANSPDWNPKEQNLEWASRAAVLFADALIAELAKPKP